MRLLHHALPVVCQLQAATLTPSRECAISGLLSLNEADARKRKRVLSPGSRRGAVPAVGGVTLALSLSGLHGSSCGAAAATAAVHTAVVSPTCRGGGYALGLSSSTPVGGRSGHASRSTPPLWPSEWRGSERPDGVVTPAVPPSYALNSPRACAAPDDADDAAVVPRRVGVDGCGRGCATACYGDCGAGVTAADSSHERAHALGDVDVTAGVGDVGARPGSAALTMFTPSPKGWSHQQLAAATTAFWTPAALPIPGGRSSATPHERRKRHNSTASEAASAADGHSVSPVDAACDAECGDGALSLSKIGRKTDFVAKKLPNERNKRGVTHARKLVNMAAGIDPMKRWRHGVGSRDTAINAQDAEKVRFDGRPASCGALRSGCEHDAWWVCSTDSGRVSGPLPRVHDARHDQLEAHPREACQYGPACCCC
jgi:hypothetical protein